MRFGCEVLPDLRQQIAVGYMYYLCYCIIRLEL